MAEMTRITSILDWLDYQRMYCKMRVKEVYMSELERWDIGTRTGNIFHETGEFFSIVGMHVREADNRETTDWFQPMIHQREMGILGLLVRMNESGVDEYLLQAKAEPGNVEKLLLSPTLQSTRSNLRKAHGGTKSRYAEFFETQGPWTIEYDCDQTEDGGRFYQKTNRNMIVRISEKQTIVIPDHFMWLTLAEIKDLLQYPCVINHAVRSIIAAVR
jgi:oxidase EvaA